jgi:hypothetical protein
LQILCAVITLLNTGSIIKRAKLALVTACPSLIAPTIYSLQSATQTIPSEAGGIVLRFYKLDKIQHNF